MTELAMLELKQTIARLKESERKEISTYLQSLKRNSPAWKGELSRRMAEMDQGKKVVLKDLAKQLGHG